MIRVLDTSALLAFINDEQGYEKVQKIFDTPQCLFYVHAINLCEVYYVTLRNNQNHEVMAEQALAELRVFGLQTNNEMGPLFWRQAAKFKAKYSHLSLADVFCVTLAHHLGAEVVTADHGFRSVHETGVCPVLFIRHREYPMPNRSLLQKLAREHGTPLFVVDHDQLRKNYAEFKKYLPRVQAYYAVKANSDPAIVRTLYGAGASFDVASMPEFLTVHENIKNLPEKERQHWIWDKIIYANPIKAPETLEQLDQYKPLVTYDNYEEIKKIKKHAPHAGLALRLKVPNTGAMVELSSKFGADPGEAVSLIAAAHDAGLTVEGLSFHVGSQTTNFENYVQALQMAVGVFNEARLRGFTKMNVIDLGGGFPAPYDANVQPFRVLAKRINHEIQRLFPEKNIEILAEPGRFMVATAATLVAQVIGKAVRNGKQCYYINDGVYHTYSGVIFDHCKYPVKAFKKGPTQICAVFGPTCDALDTISLSEELPDLQLGDLVYSENIGAYSHASSTYFNGFPPAKVLHINE